ncbi:hypothetical protein BaRGS_00028278 [Batillaria attramentaria]|uniref:Uncharacterized protein n=1 Tax=Batillaria attramentaria TaxID=370345 RepID=A0ABD0K0C3_9CAEN
MNGCEGNIYCRIVLTVGILLQTVVLADSLPTWKTQLVHFRRWSGTYEYQNAAHKCTLVVHSVQYDNDGGASVSFKTDEIAIDMNAFSSDNVTVLFTKEAQDFNHPHFPGSQDLEFEVKLVTGKLSSFAGTITKPENAGYGSIRFSPEGSNRGTPKNYTRSSSLSIGLAVGISLFMLIVCIVIGIVILRWAIRKGYLRHVAMSYKNFRNPQDTPVSFDSQPTDGQVEGNVHI